MLRVVPKFKGCLGFALALLLALEAVGGGAAQAASNAAALSPVVPIVKKASPAVVNIDVETKAKRTAVPFPFDDDPIFRHFFGEAFKNFTRSVPMKGRGSGFIVSKEGQILTNNHVIDGVDKITVTLSDGKTYSAKVVGKDPTFDLAVIKIDPEQDLPVLPLGDSDTVEVGEWVVAIGNPYGLEHSVTVGVISAKNRSIHARDVNFDGFLQTDAAINPGNSGGPLLNMDGEVVGINTAILPYAQGLGFAVPVNMAKQIMGDLVSYGKVKRGWLGISVQNLTPEIAEAYGVEEKSGVIVGDVFADSAADKAGLMRGDVVTALNGEKVKDVLWFVNKVRSQAPNSELRMDVLREGKKLTLKARLNERPDDPDGKPSSESDSIEGASEALEKVGLRVAPINRELRREYKLDPKSDGLLVVEVEDGSPAQMAGIGEGDRLLQVNGRKVVTVEDLKGAMQRKSDSVVLLIDRGGKTFFVSLQKGGAESK
ncbi:MAG: Do family serine endopeptidase [Fretibacterium sp.]|nr:Do family serine endopeptidase [Fretibacterium sp.]